MPAMSYFFKKKITQKEENGSRNNIERFLEAVKLTPGDIPGAFIENESEVGKWAVDKLKFWLKCRRLNQQGNKKALLAK